MSAGTYVLQQPSHGMPFKRRLANILGLALGWCLMVSVMFIQISTSTVAARDFNGAATATLPPGIMMAAATLSMTPGTLLMGRFGRRPVLLTSAAGAIVGAALMAVAARLRLLWLLIVGCIPLGVCFAQANNLRFAAVEFAPRGFEANALSLVVTGAMLSCVVGPEVSRHTRRALDAEYVGSYIFMTGLCVAYAVLVSVVEFHKLPTGASGAGAAAAAATQQQQQVSPVREGAAVDDLAVHVASHDVVDSKKTPGPAPAVLQDGADGGIAAQPQVVLVTGVSAATQGSLVTGVGACEQGGKGASGPFASDGAESQQLTPAVGVPAQGQPGVGDGARQRRPFSRLLFSWPYAVAVLTAGLSYGGMAGMMTATPLATADAEYSFSQTTQVIQVHILSMFVPSLFTGEVVRIITAPYTMLIGAIVLLGGTAVFFAATSLPVFFAANAVVGIGWNWAYVGASAIVSRAYEPHMKFAAQGTMDTVVLLGTGLAVSLAGRLYSWLGWRTYIAVYMVVNGMSVVLDGLLLTCHRK